MLQSVDNIFLPKTKEAIINIIKDVINPHNCEKYFYMYKNLCKENMPNECMPLIYIIYNDLLKFEKNLTKIVHNVHDYYTYSGESYFNIKIKNKSYYILSNKNNNIEFYLINKQDNNKAFIGEVKNFNEYLEIFKKFYK